MTIEERVDAFNAATGLPVTRLCKKIELSPQGYYSWRRGEVRLKFETLQRIDRFLIQFNY